MKNSLFCYNRKRYLSSNTYTIKYTHDVFHRLLGWIAKRFRLYYVEPAWDTNVEVTTIYFDNLMDAIRQQMTNFLEEGRKPYAIVMGPAQEHLIKSNFLNFTYLNIPANKDIPQTLWGLDLIINPYVQQTPIVLAK